MRLKEQNSIRVAGHVFEVKWQDIKTLKYNIDQTMAQLLKYKQTIDFVNPAQHIGISQHIVSDGFIYFIGLEVKPQSVIPEDFETFVVPKGLVLYVKHITLEKISEAYDALHKWLEDSEYTVYKASGVTYYDPLPIKYEHYNKANGTLEIRIPVLKTL